MFAHVLNCLHPALTWMALTTSRILVEPTKNINGQCIVYDCTDANAASRRLQEPWTGATKFD